MNELPAFIATYFMRTQTSFLNRCECFNITLQHCHVESSMEFFSQSQTLMKIYLLEIDALVPNEQLFWEL